MRYAAISAPRAADFAHAPRRGRRRILLSARYGSAADRRRHDFIAAMILMFAPAARAAARERRNVCAA